MTTPDLAAITASRGRLAQLVERLLYTEDVGGSSPSSPTRIVQVLLRRNNRAATAMRHNG